MKKLIYLIVVIVALSFIVAGCTTSVVPPAEQNETSSLTKGAGNGWINYGNIKVEWIWDESEGKYQYTWKQDRDLNGVYCEGMVEVDYGRYTDYFGVAPIMRDESCEDDFDGAHGFVDDTKNEWTDKVIHLTESWVPGVTVPGDVNRFVVKDNDGDGIYEGGFTTPLFWDDVTVQGDPAGPFLIKNTFEYHYDMNDDGNGYYIQCQYMHIPEE